MKTFKDYMHQLDEAVEKSKALKHLEHIEDELLNFRPDQPASRGVDVALDYLWKTFHYMAGTSSDKFNMLTKWDGIGIVTGIDPSDGKFFASTKGATNVTPVLAKSTDAHTPENTGLHDAFPDKEGKDGNLIDYSGLRKKIEMCLTHLPKLGKETIIHGDLQFTEGDVKTMNPLPDKRPHLAFKPNTITYMVPLHDDVGRPLDIAQNIQSAKIGIVLHTEYDKGTTVEETMRLGPSYGFDSSKLKRSPDVWFGDALIRNVAGQLKLTAGETEEVRQQLELAQQKANELKQSRIVFDWLDSNVEGTLKTKKFMDNLKVSINSHLRNFETQKRQSQTGYEFKKDEVAVTGYDNPFERDAEAFADEFLQRYSQKYSKVQAKQDEISQYINQHVDEFKALYEMYLMIMDTKLMIMPKIEELKSIDDIFSYLPGAGGQLEKGRGEGLVAVDIDDSGDQAAVKLVDRAYFSAYNFTTGKPSG